MGRGATYELDDHRVQVTEFGTVSVDYIKIGTVEKQANRWHATKNGGDLPVAVGEKNRKAAVMILAQQHIEQIPERPCSMMQDHRRMGIDLYAPAVVTVEAYDNFRWVKRDVCEHCLADRGQKVVNYFDPEDCKANHLGEDGSGIDLRSVDGWIAKHETRWEDRNLNPVPTDGLRAWEQIDSYRTEPDAREFFDAFYEQVRDRLMQRDDVGPWIKGVNNVEISEKGYGGGLGRRSNYLAKFIAGYAVVEYLSGGQYEVVCQGMRAGGSSLETALARFLRECGGILMSSPTGPTVEHYKTKSLIVKGPRGEKLLEFGDKEALPFLLTDVGDWFEYNGCSREAGYEALLKLLEVM